MPDKQRNGIAYALAWPMTYCKQPGSWYDGLMHLLGVSKNRYYRVGHAAVLLISKNSGACHYFDFGRYHAPFGFGRIRSAETDTDLRLETRAVFNADGVLLNAEAILTELYLNPSCHGEGPLHAACCMVHFDKALLKANAMQEAGVWMYGPFVPRGSNCSRFVRTVLLAGKPEMKQRLRLALPLSLSPTPYHNVRSLENYIKIA